MAYFIKAFCLICSIVLLSACGNITPKKTPSDQEYQAWLTRYQATYNQDVYLTATGTSNSAELAKERARINLSQIFNVTVNSQTIGFTSVSSGFSGSTGEKSKQLFNESNQTRTEMLIEGSQIPSVFFNDTDLTFTAFIAMNRKIAERSMTLDRDDLDVKGRALLAQLDTQDPLARIAIFQQLTEVTIEREKINKKLRIITKQLIDDSPFASPAEYKKLQSQLFKEVTYAITIKSTILHKNDIQRIMVQNKFSNQQDASDARYIFAFNLETEETKEYDGRYWQNAVLYLDITDQDQGDVLKASVNWKLKVTSKNEDKLTEQLKNRTITTLEDEFLAAVIAGIQNF